MKKCEDCALVLLDEEIEYCLNNLCCGCCEEDHLSNDKPCLSTDCFYIDCSVKKVT